MSNRAATAVIHDGGYSIGYADRNVPGYTPTTYTLGSWEEASGLAKRINAEAFGVTEAEASEIVLSSMRLGGVE